MRSDWLSDNLCLNKVPGRKTNPLGALVNIVCFNGQMATRCYPIELKVNKAFIPNAEAEADNECWGDVKSC